MDLLSQTNLSGRTLCPLAVGCVYILLCAFYSFPLYQRSNLCTKNVCFHTCTLGLHAGQISSGYFFLLSSPLFVQHYTWAELTAAYVYGLGKLLLLLSLRPFAHIVFLVFSLYLFLFACISPFFYIWVQTLCDTCNSTWNVLNYLYRLLS